MVIATDPVKTASAPRDSSVAAEAEFTHRLFSVRGKTALITGGTSGIGAMIADGLAAAGAMTYRVSRRANAAAQIGPNSEHIAADLSSKEGIDQVVREFLGRSSRLDILVNAAGTHTAAPIDDFTDDTWDDVVGLNFKSVFFLTQKLLPALRNAASRDSPSRVINIGSSAGLHAPTLENYAYSSAKAGIHHLTRHLARRLAPDNINVNAIAPGPFPSRNFASLTDDFRKQIAANIPLGRLGTTEDVAGAALFLTSRAGAYVTGAVLSLDGGLIALL